MKRNLAVKYKREQCNISVKFLSKVVKIKIRVTV